MRKFKIVSAIIVVLIATGIVAYDFRYPLLLKFAQTMVPLFQPEVVPFKEIAWQSGTDPRNRPADKRPPNVVLILADDLGWNDITLNGGGVGGGLVPTPSIDSIARDGVNFTNGYAANATCAPSRAAILSGRYPTRFGFEFTPVPPGFMALTSLGQETMFPELPQGLKHEVENDPSYNLKGMPASEKTIAELLSEQGYHNAHIGKWHVGLSNGMGPLDQGFDESLLMINILYQPEDDPNVVNAKIEFDPIDRFLWSISDATSSTDGGKTSFRPKTYLTDFYTDEAIKVIEANKDRPFFLYLAHWAVHTPLQASREDYELLSQIENHRERVYAAMVMSLERSVKRVLQALEDQGLSDNTIVIFTSDNGGAPYIGLPEINKPYRGWKLTFFEGGIHVPYMIKWPEQIPAGGQYDKPVQGFDLFSTIVAAAGAEAPADVEIDGVDLLPYVLGDKTGAPHKTLFWSSGASQSALVGHWKLNVSNPPGRSWLFDLSVDPTEQHDLSNKYPEKLAELKAALAAHNAKLPPPSWQATRSVPVRIDKDLSEPFTPDDETIYWSN